MLALRTYILTSFICEKKLEVDQAIKLHPLIDEMLRWRNIIGVDYQQYKAEKVKQSIY